VHATDRWRAMRTLARRLLRTATAVTLLALAARPAVLAAQDQRAVPTPRQVSLLIYVIDLVAVDGAAQTFSADVFLAARWNDPSLADPGGGVRTFSSSEVWTPAIVVVNDRGASSSLDDQVQVDAEGNAQLTRRLTGDFSVPLDLRKFPQDRQHLAIWVIAPPLGGELIELTPDRTATILRGDEFSISDWHLGPLTIESREYTDTPNAAPVSGVALTIEVSRKQGYYLVQILLPLCAIVLMAGVVYWVDPTVVATRVGVVVTTMLTLIAYRFMLGGLVPRLSYLTRLDWFMLFSTLLVLVTMIAMGATSYLIRAGKEEAVARIDRLGRIGVPATLVIVTLLIWVF